MFPRKGRGLSRPLLYRLSHIYLLYNLLTYLFTEAIRDDHTTHSAASGANRVILGAYPRLYTITVRLNVITTLPS
jgi:hypothetical protein